MMMVPGNFVMNKSYEETMYLCGLNHFVQISLYSVGVQLYFDKFFVVLRRTPHPSRVLFIYNEFMFISDKKKKNHMKKHFIVETIIQIILQKYKCVLCCGIAQVPLYIYIICLSNKLQKCKCEIMVENLTVSENLEMCRHLSIHMRYKRKCYKKIRRSQF